MKILHITASYKPAFIYGGPIYSVAALCEGLVDGGFDSSFDSAQADIAQDDLGIGLVSAQPDYLKTEVMRAITGGLRTR